jgi:hypothetical protein
MRMPRQSPASEAVAADKSAPNMSATYSTTDMSTAEIRRLRGRL